MQNRIQFAAENNTRLAGVLHTPDAGKPRAYALFAHCFTCTKNIKAAINIAESLCHEGIAVLRFDFTGLGQSEGEFSNTHFSSNVQDLLHAAKYLEAEHSAPVILVGHSLGGTACLAAASQIDSVKAVATIGSPADAEHVLHLLQDNIETIEQQGEAKVQLAGQSFNIRKDFIDDVRSQSVRDGIRNLRRALLVMHSPVDELVPVSEAARIYTSALHPKSFVSLDDADHLLSKERDSRYAGQVLAAWASRYMEPLPVIPDARFMAGEVLVSGRSADQFQVSINANGHPLKGDEPEDYGGLDSGPSPYDLLSAALGACTVMTINMYARHKKLSLESVEVSTSHGKIHATDCVACESKEGKIDRFKRTIRLTGDLTNEQRQRLLEIADRCPVHKTLHGEVEIVNELVS
jgi:putative redox protein